MITASTRSLPLVAATRPALARPRALPQRSGHAAPLVGPAAVAGARARVVAAATVALSSILFDCDGVIIESEDLHRIAYCDAFEHFDVRINGERVVWTEEFYDVFQNRVGGGKPKMRAYFSDNGWPTTTAHTDPTTVPATQEEREAVIDILQEWKSARYQALILAGAMDARPGVLRLMDEAREAGINLGVCSAATKSSVLAVLPVLLGEGRFKGLDVFLAGDDVAAKKPDPQIYREAARRLGVDPASCVVIEDSAIGAAAAAGAGMRCVVTYTRSTRTQTFPGAERVVACLTHDDGRPAVTVKELMKGGVVQDDRVEFKA